MKFLDKLKGLFEKKKEKDQQRDSGIKLTKQQMIRVGKNIQKRMKAERKMNARPREEFPCRVCTKPMLVGRGQLAYFHAECRPFRHNISKYREHAMA